MDLSPLFPSKTISLHPLLALPSTHPLEVMFLQLFVLSLLLSRNLVTASLFSEDSLVTSIGYDEFKSSMEEKMAFVVAFVASGCDECERLAPEYSKTALGLYPFLPMYAVDCETTVNKRLCSDLNVTKVPTVKLFPRGKYMDPVNFKPDGPDVSASELYYFAQRGVPDKVKILRYFEDIGQINTRESLRKPRALLMKKTNKLPLLWSVLANKYNDDIAFYSHRDWRGRSSVKMGFGAGEESESKVLIYPTGGMRPVQYRGLLNLDSLSTLFDALLDGTESIDQLNAKAAAEEFVPDPKELKIEQQQEMEILKLAHGGFADLIDFEAAIRDGSAKNFHGKRGYPGMMGGAQHAAAHGVGEKRRGQGSESSRPTGTMMPITDGQNQIVIDATAPTTSGMPTVDGAGTTQGVGIPRGREEEAIRNEKVTVPGLPMETLHRETEDRVKDEL